MASYPETIDDLAPLPQRRGWRRFLVRHLPGLSFIILLGLLIAVVLWPYVVITVPSGYVGVLWKRFNGLDMYCWCWVGRGTVLDPRELREEGLHIIWPWDKLYLYNLRLQSTQQTYNAISKDGVNVKAQISVRYQLLHNSVAVLHKFIGPDFLTSVVNPEIGSQARQVISQFTAEAVYTSREQIQKQIRDATQKSLAANLNKLVQPEAMEQPDPKHYNDFLQDAIQILDTLVLSIELPPDIVAAINRQTEQFYMIQEYKFRVEREAEESKRKQIEADGIAAFQKTVSQGISESYLRWRGIEATLLLSQSPNAKVVVIGSGRDGLPIILNAEPSTPGAASQSGGSGASSTTAPSGNALPPAPNSSAPPNTSTAPGATPGSPGSPPAKPPPGTSGAATPVAPDETANAGPVVLAQPEKTASAATVLDIPGVRPILSGISGALRAGADLISPQTKSKQ
ncbi:MAG TPA: prohibitin family protein [Xanthobacteraceae bacterium]|jgi:regulator of protease activity HflC (stomatin/prohibitin superfamily)|nr:prohibitin family protein [Xanthobacteraceae bacterium]